MPSTPFTYSVGDREGQVIAQFHVDHAGTYTLTTQDSSGESGSQFSLAIARGSPSDTIGYVLGGLAAFGLLFVGAGIAIFTLVMRLVRRQAS